jgi:hypothetical protein
MKKFAGWLVYLLIGLPFVVFLVANRAPVAISLDPFNADDPGIATPPLPLWFWLATALLIGFALGVIGMWLSGRPNRLKAKANMRELKSLRSALAQKTADGEPPMLDVRET